MVNMADLKLLKVPLCLLLLVVVVCDAQVREGEIRFSGNDPRRGLVEVYFDGQWGTISTLELDEHVPSVICRQLGFQGEAKGETPEDAIGPISSPVWKFTCSEGVSSVLECDRIKNQPISDPSYGDYSIVDVNNWDHNNDLGVVCEEQKVPTDLFIVINIVLFMVLLLIILCFACIAYRFASRKNKIECNKADDNPDAGLYIQPGPTNGTYSHYVTVSEETSKGAEKESEDLKMKDLSTEEEYAEVPEHKMTVT